MNIEDDIRLSSINMWAGHIASKDCSLKLSNSLTKITVTNQITY